MRTEFLKQFISDIDKLSVKSVRAEIKKVIKNVEDSSSPAGIRGLKKLSVDNLDHADPQIRAVKRSFLS